MTEAEGYGNIVTVNLSRKDVRKKRWKKKYYELDDNWVSPEDSKKFGLIEHDKTKTSHELKFSAKIKIKGIVEIGPSYSIKIESKESWIKTDEYEGRDTFARTNKQDLGHGTKDGYRVYKSGDVSWTLPLREF